MTTDTVAAMLAGQMQEQKAAEEKFREQQDQSQRRLNGVYDDILSKVTQQHKGPVYPKEIIDIANALLANPRLIAPVGQFLARLVARINAAIDAEIMAMSKAEEPPK